jgi:hypothetical protein
LSGSAVTAQAACSPGTLIRGTSATTTEPSYLRSMALALDEFARTPGNLDMNATSGRLSIAVDEKNIFDIQPNSFKVEVEIRTSYSGVADGTGLKVRKAKYVFETNPSCSDLNLIGQIAETALPIGAADVGMSSAVQTAFTEYMMAPNAIPQNRHSGGHRILIHTPQMCPSGATASVNLVRSHHVSSIVYRTSTYLANIANRTVTDSKVQAGRLLPDLCR